jgi:hypothetical protein
METFCSLNFRKMVKKTLIGIAVIALLAVFGNFIRIKIIENRINDGYVSILASHKGEKYRISNFSVMDQQYYYSCSIATICSLINYYGNEITEDEFMEKNGIGLNMVGMSPEDFYKYLKPSIENFDIKMNVNADFFLKCEFYGEKLRKESGSLKPCEVDY